MHGHLTASRLRDLQRYRIPAAGAAVVLVAILVGQAIQVGPGPGPSGPTSSEPITWTSGGPAGTGPASSTFPTGSWTHLVLGPDTRPADLTATSLVGSRVATTSHFLLRSLGATSAADLASGIKVDPEVRLTVTPGASSASVALEPNAPLQDGVRYRFKLFAPDGSLLGTWAFRTEAPLRVVSRLPTGQTTQVPLATGIEVTFDQPDVVDFAGHFSISPKVAGRFEQHDRTWVFVPTTTLAPLTIYTITLTKGLATAGPGRALEADLRWQFQTTTADQHDRTPAPDFGQALFESRLGDNPVLVVDYGVQEGQRKATTWPYELYRLPTLEAAADAANRLTSTPPWASGNHPAASVIDTSKLTRVAAGTAAIDNLTGPQGGVDYLRLPIKPDEGWYIVVLLKVQQPTQALLQVTDLAAFVQTTDTRTVTWLSDLRTQGPVPGATVSIRGGATLGTTDAKGVLVAPTPTSVITYLEDPQSWVSPIPHVLAIRARDGRGLVALVGMYTDWAYPPQIQSASMAHTPAADWWLLLSTDRSTYRTDDVIHAWGLLKARDGAAVPSGVELRLAALNGGDASPNGGDASPALATVPVTLTSRGVFSADVPVRDLPRSSYVLSLYVGARLVQSQWIEVAEIRKPAYQIGLTADRRVYVAGDPLTVKGEVSFYDGSRTPDISIQTAADQMHATSTTDGDGRFTASFTARMAEWQPNEGWNWYQLTSAPATPEEGSITGELNVVVFPSRVWLAGDAALAGSRLSIHGTLTQLDPAKVEGQLANAEWDLDPAGAPVAGRAVGVRVIDLIPVKRQIGMAYDFINKLTRPVYEYSTQEQVLMTRTVTTDAAGRLSLGVDVRAVEHEYRVELTARDSQSRLVQLTLTASQRRTDVEPWSYPYLVTTRSCGDPTVTTSLGATSTIVVHEADGSLGRDGQYLFMVGRAGLADAVWQSSATFRRTFSAADVPGYAIHAARLTPTGYQVLNGVNVRVDPASKAIGVTLTPERARYRPGDTVTVAVRTLGPNGRPIAADVVVRAVDEKLFASGGALDVDVAAQLLAMRPSGFLQTYVSHQLPYLSEGGCGGGGNGPRGDFRDSATFQRIQTGQDGRGTVSFVVPDDLTSWHVSASAISSDLDAGSASVLVPVGLPFFAEAVLAPQYLAGERPILVVRAYGDALNAGDAVRFTVSSSALGLAPVSVTGRAFEPRSITLPVLAPGRYSVTIQASAGVAMVDALTRTVDVVPSRLGRLEQRQDALVGTLNPVGGAGLTTYVIGDRGRGSLVPILSSLASETGARVDQAAAGSMARQLLIDQFGVDPADLRADPFDMARYQHTGVGLLPYASADPYLTAMFALVAPETLASSSSASDYLRSELLGPQTGDELRIVALAGLAGLGQDVLDELRAFDAASLSVTARLWLGLGLLAAGDESAARAIERNLLSTAGERLGPWVRLGVGANAPTLAATGLMLVLAGKLGDETAAGLQAYIASQPSSERVFPIETLAYVRGAIDRLPRTEGRFAWTVGGERHEVTLKPGGTFSLSLTSAQRATFRLERLAGDLTVSSSWIGPASASDLAATPGLTVDRVVRPATNAPRDHLVHVTLTITFGSAIPAGSYDVTDLTPSGLAPLATTGTWPDETGVDEAASALPLAPYAVDGQRVSWIVSPQTARGNQLVLAYDARVVSPGTYVWEPAVVQSTVAAVIGAHTGTTAFVIQ